MPRTKTLRQPPELESTTPARPLSFWHRFAPVMLVAGIGFVAGVFWLVGIRFLAVRPAETHYHANFAVVIDGVQQPFDHFTYYEEVAACSSAYSDNPKGRVHMHGNVNDVIHVHDKRVTYADFFQNIDWILGPDFMRTDSGILANTADKKWVFLLNGETRDRVDNLVIESGDKLLLAYRMTETDVARTYAALPATAPSYNNRQDPGSCSGLNGGASSSWRTRLWRALAG